MRRTILAILAGPVTTGLALMAGATLNFNVGFYIQEVLAWVLPISWPDPVFVAVLNLAVGMLIALPGVVGAVLLARRRVYPRGHCQRCGYNLMGNVSGRCPECG